MRWVQQAVAKRVSRREFLIGSPGILDDYTLLSDFGIRSPGPISVPETPR